MNNVRQSVKKGWLQIRPDDLSGLIRAQTVCKDYQQTAVRILLYSDSMMESKTF